MSRVLIVEDDLFLQEAMAAMVERFDHDADIAGDAEQCLEQVMNTETQPDVLLLDLNLPDMHGTEIISAIRKVYDQTVLPIIVISSISQSESVVDALSRGANDYITKPAKPEELEARIASCLAMRKTAEKKVEKAQNEVLRQSLGAACHHVAQPVTALQSEIELLKEDVGSNIMVGEGVIDELLARVQEASQVIHRLQRTREYKTIPYLGESRIVELED